MIATALVPFLLAATFQPAVSQQFLSSRGDTRLEAGVLSLPLQGKLRTAVSGYALSRRDALGLPPTSLLSVPEAFGTRFGASFHMDQVVDGVPVYGAKVIVTVDRNRRVVQLSSSVVPYQHALQHWKLSMDEALELASSRTQWAMRANDGRPYGGVKRMMFPVGDEVHAGYLVWVPTLDLTHNWYLAVDASDGEVLWTQDRAYHAANDAVAYLNSPGGLDGGVGVTPTQPVTLSHFGAGHEDGGYLFGDQLVMWNCCVNAGCSTAPGAKPKRAVGQTTVYGFPISYDIAICDRMQRATNDPAKHPSGDYVYTPVDAPATSQFASQSVPSDTDEFSEVHAFYHVNNVYDFVRSLSTAAQPLFPGEEIPGFQTRDEKAGKRLAVWSNVLLPDFQQAQSTLGTGVAKADNLIRVDNAAYMEKENFDQLLIPELSFDTDALFIFQGNTADFGYDAPVYWHEFGHGVIFATAAFNSFTLDERSGNNEGAALHEGIADYFAAAFGRNPVIGEYVGPRLAALTPGTESGLRNLGNNFSCPEVLWGEPHQDSQHFSAALWQARQTLFQGTDLGDTFDAAFYAALVSMTPATDFAQAAAAVENHVKLAFPQVADADQKMKEIFDARGVTGCSKVVDLTGSTEPRHYYGMGGSQQAGLAQGQVVPGPYQMKFHLPNGAKSLTLTAGVPPSMNPFAGTPNVRLYAKSGAPITFTRSGTTLANDADKELKLSGTSSLSGTLAIDVPCGGDLYFTLGSGNPGGDAIMAVHASYAPADTCASGPDAGSDAGVDEDAGTPPSQDGGVVRVPAIPDGGTSVGGKLHTGCGCNTVDPSLAAFGLLALLGVARRRRTR